MPTYDYRCKACGQELEVFQSFSDDPLTTCEACGGELRKLFGAPGIAFKGSGFYKNDSRGSRKSTSAVVVATRAARDDERLVELGQELLGLVELEQRVGRLQEGAGRQLVVQGRLLLVVGAVGPFRRRRATASVGRASPG